MNIAAGGEKDRSESQWACLRTFLPMWRVARKTKRHEVWLATTPTRSERSDWTLDWAPGEEISLANVSPFCPFTDFQPRAARYLGTNRTDLPLDRRTGLPPPSSLSKVASTPESSVKTVKTGPNRLRSRSSRVGSSPALRRLLPSSLSLPAYPISTRSSSHCQVSPR